MKPIRIEKIGRRLYAFDTPFEAKDRLRGLCTWDPEKRAWWCGTSKEKDLRELVEEITGTASRDPVVRAILADKAEDAGDEAKAAELRAPPKQQDPHDIRLTGKGRYKGKIYYAGSITRDGLKVRLLTLPDRDGKYLDFWAPCSEVEEVKRYEAREVWDGRRYSGKTVTQYTTLGSIARFVQQQRDGTTQRVQCAECGSWYDAMNGGQCQECGGA